MADKGMLNQLPTDVNITDKNLVESNQMIQSKPIRGKRKDWSFIDTREFQSASNQKVNFVGRSPRVKAQVNYKEEQVIMWLDW